MKNVRAKLGLGTVQWGLDYGLANHGGKTPLDIVGQILAQARRLDVEVLDTASMYGDSEIVLGSFKLDGFKVVTKTPRVGKAEVSKEDVAHVYDTFMLSLKRLNQSKVYGLLCHHADDLVMPGGEDLIDLLGQLKAKGLVEKIGVSVYESKQLAAILEVLRPDIVQLPLSVLDQRMLLDGSISRLKEMGIEIHARSAFLQGLLLMRMEEVPGYFQPIRPLLEKWHASVASQRLTLLQAALAFVRDLPEVDTVLVGVQDLAQFESCYQDFYSETVFSGAGLACNDPAYVNPALWKLA
jgi:aryl-alcohol dehydrogenase-like predicted oxidoreductase